VHGRTGFAPRYDGKDRWLQRTFVMNDLRRSRFQRPGDGYVLV
jgi:L-asparagine oxygenase